MRGARMLACCLMLLVLPNVVHGFACTKMPLQLRESRALSARAVPAPLRQKTRQLRSPKMMLQGGDGAIYLAEEIFAQVAAGGIAIIFSGIVGAFFVGNIANIEGLEADMNQNRKDELEESSLKNQAAEDDDYFTGDGVEKPSSGETSK